ncbi:hypothetical protein [Stutzerimonas kunmingensis]|uniref:hypothetical protein n=1 Tax=Stutzerimonas kunmingensis TaxID=1211807 RepID=UPI0028A60358|nr:hypothetical protein [Stutzerimonas kunmingensis]
MAVADQFETVQKLYIAFYQRPADFAGRDYWAGQVEAQGLLSVINAFATSAEATALYGEINADTIGDVIDQIYTAAFGRPADEAGKAWYIEQFNAGEFTAATIALNVVNGAAGDDATTLGNKVQAADLFTAAVENVEYNEADITAARDFLAGVTTTVPTQAEVDAVVEEIGAEEPGEFTLTQGLEDLQGAQAAKVAFLEGLALDTDFDGEVDVEAGDAVASDVTALVDTAADTLAANDFTTLSKANLLDTSKIALQDADISVAISAAEKAVATATNNAAAGTTALLEAVTAQVDAQEALLVAEQKAIEAYNDEETAFEAVNSQTVGTALGNLAVVDGQWGVSNGAGALTTVYAKQVSGAWTLTADGKAATNIKGYADLLAAYDAKEAANDATEAGSTLLENAVEAVLLAEFDGYSVKDFGTVIAGATTPSLTPSVSVDYNAGDAVVYRTAADEAAGNGTAEKFTVTFGAAVAEGGTVEFDDYIYTAGVGGATATAAATAFAGGYTETNYTVVDNGNGTLTFTAKVVGDVEVTTTDFTGTGAAAVTDVSVNVEGVDAGDTTPIVSVNTEAQALADALASLSNLQEAVANYEYARDLNAQLTAADAAIAEATAAITDSVEDGGLGVNLLASTATAFTSKDDVLLYSEGADKALANFGLSGEDKIFFGGDFKFVGLADDKAITDNVGDASALEILWDQQGSNLVLYVEEETFAGNSSAGAGADITTITLTGVDAADVSFEGGFLVIA